MEYGTGLLTTDGAVFNVTNEIEIVDCVAEGCNCYAVHRRLTGRKFVTFETEGQRFTGELVRGTDKWEPVI